MSYMLILFAYLKRRNLGAGLVTRQAKAPFELPLSHIPRLNLHSFTSMELSANVSQEVTGMPEVIESLPHRYSSQLLSSSWSSPGCYGHLGMDMRMEDVHFLSFSLLFKLNRNGYLEKNKFKISGHLLLFQRNFPKNKHLGELTWYHAQMR